MLDPRTPVLVGVGTVTQRSDDTTPATDLAEPLALMVQATAAAAGDAGVPALAAAAGLVLVPKGIWDYPDAAGQLATAIGARAHTVVGEVGILQQTLITRAAAEIAAGRLDVAVVAGGEARQRAVRAARQGVTVGDTLVPGRPDELLVPHGDIITAVEIERDLAVPAHQYALVESVLRHADGLTADQQAARLGRLWAAFARVAATNPHAWDRTSPDAAAITEPSPVNRIIATPYAKRLCSQWNVDQAAALVLTSVAQAEAVGVPRDRWVFLAATAESQAMVALPNRVDLDRSVGTALAGRAALGALGLEADQVGYHDIYSCFPAAVQVQARELDLALDRPLTVTGGMTFAGGPLNSYVLHATAALADRLRHDPGAMGMVTSVSGMLTKPAVALWSTDPHDDTLASGPPLRSFDVTDEALAAIATCPVDATATGPGRIVAHTVIHDRGEPSRAVAVVQLDRGVRTVAVDADADRARATVAHDRVGQRVRVTDAGVFV